MNDTLSTLMRHATDDLEPVTSDLLDRSVQHGLRLRRRRTTLQAVTGAAAVVGTIGLVAGGIQFLGERPEAVSPAAVPATQTSVQNGATRAQTLATLKRLVSGPGRTLSKPVVRGTENDFIAASVIVDDGRGKSFIEVLVAGGNVVVPCDPPVSGCRVNPDGSAQYMVSESPEYSDSRQAIAGVISNRFELQFGDGRFIGLTSYNASQEKDAKHTRPKPLFTTRQLVALAHNKAWKFPG